MFGLYFYTMMDDMVTAITQAWTVRLIKNGLVIGVWRLATPS